MKKFILFAAFMLLAGSASAQFESPGGLSRGLANALYCALNGCTMTGTLSFTGSGKLASAFPIAVGTGTATANVSGTYAKFVSAAGVGNAADATDDALWTLTPIPANTFTANGDTLLLTVNGKAANTVNNKHLGFTVGGTQLNGANNTSGNVAIVGICQITRVDATHINVAATMVIGTALASAFSYNLVVSDLTTNTLAVVVTGASPTASAANDVLLFSGVAEFKK